MFTARLADVRKELFSVIIPVYNRATMIRSTIDSVLRQEGASCEIIVVDDGSTDDTPSVLAGYGDAIRVVRQVNRGPGAARNLGICHASGEYLVFLDSDDVWPPWTLEVYSEVIVGHDKPAIIAGRLGYIRDPIDLTATEKVKTEVRSFSDFITAGMQGVYMGAGQAAIRADLLRKCGGFVDHRVNAEDHDLAIRLGAAGKFIMIDAPLMVACRQHDESVSRNFHNTYLGMRLLITREVNLEYPGGAERQLARRTIIASHARPVTFELVRHGWFREACDLYARTLKWHFEQRRFRFIIALPVFLAWQSCREYLVPKKGRRQ